jgi:hypothetical protein
MYQWESSLPSGHPLTTIINNMYNAVLMMCCWSDANNRSVSSYDSFFDNIALLTYGDDNIFSVTPEGSARHLFNEITLSTLMTRYGMVYTNDSKAKSEVELRPLSDISFLKRKFRFEPTINRWLAPLALETVSETYKWTRSGPDNVSIAVSNVQSSVLEYSLHGEDIFNRYAIPLIRESYRVYPDMPIKYSTFEGCLLQVVNCQLFCL